MYKLINVVTGADAGVLSENPYRLRGPLSVQKQAQKTNARPAELGEEQEPGELLFSKPDGTETTDAGFMAPAYTDFAGNEMPERWVDYPPVMINAGPLYEWREVVPTPAEIAQHIQAELTNAVQAHMDATAKLKGYDGILSAASYAALPVGEPFQAEGVAYALWRSAVWVRCYAILQEVLDGTREKVPTVDDLLAELPAMIADGE